MQHPGLSFALASVEPLHALMTDERVIEISINGHDVWAERLGESPQLTEVRLTENQIVGMIVNLANISRREVDLHDGSKFAIVSARLPGFRIEAQLTPVAVDGPYVSIRRHNARALSLNDYVRSGQLPECHLPQCPHPGDRSHRAAAADRDHPRTRCAAPQPRSS